MEQPILQVEHLTKHFPAGKGSVVHAVDDVSFTLRKGRDLRPGGGVRLRQEHAAPAPSSASMTPPRAKSSWTVRTSPSCPPVSCSPSAARCR